MKRKTKAMVKGGSSAVAEGSPYYKAGIRQLTDTHPLTHNKKGEPPYGNSP
jgi:hypothetical protein